MARYVDIDKAILMMIQMCVDIVGHGITQVDAARIATMLEDASVGDVAPKSEVEFWKQQCFHACMNNGCLDKAIADATIAREIFEEIHHEIIAALENNYKVRKQRLDRCGATDNFVSCIDGKIAALRGIDDFIEEYLKKKYTEPDAE